MFGLVYSSFPDANHLNKECYTMQNTIKISQLSREEKLRIIMEAIWEDLATDDEMVESPSWHQQALQETKIRLNSGQEKIVNWQNAKKELRKKI